MEHKALIIGGGLAAVFVGVIALKHRAKSSQAQSGSAGQMQVSGGQISAQPDMGYYYSGTVPSAVGYASSPNTQSAAIPDAANSGSSDTGGGFSLSDLLNTVATGTVKNNASQIISNAHTADSAILAGIPIPVGGSVSVNHTQTGTTVSTSAPMDPTEAGLRGLYRSLFNRDADSGGLAYYMDALKHNPSVSLADVANDMKKSNEYVSAHPNG